MINFTPVQKLIVDRATKYLSKELKTEIHIDYISLSFLYQLKLEGLQIKDRSNKNLIKVGLANVNFNNWFIFKDKLILKYISIKNVQVNTYRTINSNKWNYSFIEETFPADTSSKKNKKGLELAIKKIQADLSRLQKLADAASARSSKVEEDARAALKSLERKAVSDAAEAIKCRWELSAGRKLWESQTAAAAEKLAACQENLRKATEQLEGTLETSSITMKAFINISALLKQTWYRPSSLIAAIRKELDPLF